MQDPRWPMLRTRLVHLWLLRGPRSTQTIQGVLAVYWGKLWQAMVPKAPVLKRCCVLAINPPPCKTKRCPVDPQVHKSHTNAGPRGFASAAKRPETSTNVHQLMESVTTIPQQARDRLALPWANGFANPFMCLSHLSISLLFPSSLRLTTPLL